MMEATDPHMNDLIVSHFADLPDAAAAIAGGKGASLSRLRRAGFPVPPGFVVCTSAFRMFLDEADGHDFLSARMAQVRADDHGSAAAAAHPIREFILTRPLPSALDDHIRRGYEGLGGSAVAVRSSAVGEDGAAASFAGQHDTFLGIRGADDVARCVRECWASFFTERALFYRSQKGTLVDPRVAVVVQEMVPADASGVMFTADPVQKRRDRIVIEAVLGLGEGIVSGTVTPDHYEVDRDTGEVVSEFIGLKELAFVYDAEAGRTIEQPIAGGRNAARVLSASDLERLRQLGLRLESFFGGPQDIEWSFRSGELFLLQSRPITTL
jgi:pyruvate,water dikinase